MDMSRTMRHPDVVAGRMESIADRITHLRNKLAEAEDEMRQMIKISHEMMVATHERT